MADLFKSLQHKASPSKSGFDLSRKHVFSTKPGLAVPCLAVETVPGDHFEIDVTALSRTQTFNTAAFVRGKQRFDFYFVPNSQAWHPFNQFITQRTDKHSTQQLGHMYCPVVSLGTIHLHILTERDNQFKDMFGFSYADSMVRVLDMLGYGDFRWLLNSALTSSDYTANQLGFYTDKYVNLFRVAAYQHIWYDIYRNKYYDVLDSGGIGALPSRTDFVSAFNFDDLACDTFANSVLADGTLDSNGQPDSAFVRFRRIFSCNYIQWKKDLYTSAMPGQQFGVVSSVDISGNITLDSNTLTSSQTLLVAGNNGTNVVPGSQLFQKDTYNNNWSIPSAFDVLSLRKAEALQQWKMNTLRGGNMTDDAFESHFGVKPYYDSDENVHYLGSFSSALQVNTVESTASTGSTDPNDKVGDIGATGTILTQGHKIKFDSKDFGVIMCIASYLPEAEYSSNALDKANTLHEQFDYFTPEYQNIGLESVPLHEVSFEGEANAFNSVLGYAPRYYMYKTAVDKVFGEFKDTESLWTQGGASAESVYGTLYAWVSPRPEAFINYGSIVSRMLRTFYVSPSIYDNVFGVTADSKQDTDNLIHNVYFDIKAIRPMTVLGLPQF